MTGGLHVLGVTGSIAAGKSALAEFLAARGAEVIRLDEVGHAILAESETAAWLKETFSSGVVRIMDGSVSRAKLAELVFNDPRELARLEAKLHPEMCRRVRARVAAAREEGKGGTVVIEGALLYEMGLAADCDRVLVVDALADAREARARARHGWPAGEMARREARMESLDEKKRRADGVIENTGDERELAEELDQRLEEWQWQ